MNLLVTSFTFTVYPKYFLIISIYIDAEKWKSVGKIFKKSINFHKKDHKPLIINLIKFQ